jgi:hypothetical protein
MEGADYYLVLRRELLSPEDTEEDAKEDTSEDTEDTEEYSEWEVVKETTKTKFTNKDFETGKTYYYTVKAHLAETDTFSKKHPTGFSVTTK